MTTELFLESDDRREICFRLSCANLDSSGPFSLFPGLERIIVVTEGSGLRISDENGQSTDLLPFIPHRFDGSSQCHAEPLIDGPGRDFNVIFNPKIWSVSAVVIALPRGVPVHLLPGDERFVFAVSGALRIDGTEVPHEGLAQIFADLDVHVKAEDSCRIIVVRRKPYRAASAPTGRAN